MEFSKKLLTFRVDNNLTQTELAKIIGTKQKMISLYESGQVKPTTKNELLFNKKMGEYERSEKHV